MVREIWQDMPPLLRVVAVAAACILVCLAVVQAVTLIGNERDQNEAAELNARAQHQLQLGNYDYAQGLMYQALELDPQPSYFYTMGQANEGDGDITEAIGDYKIALQLDPGMIAAALALDRLERKE